MVLLCQLLDNYILQPFVRFVFNGFNIYVTDTAYLLVNTKEDILVYGGTGDTNENPNSPQLGREHTS